MLSLIQFLSAIQPLPEGAQQYLYRNLKQKRLRSADTWLKQGQVCFNVAFIEEGLMKSVYTKNDRTYINWFMKENDVMIAVRSFFEQIPSKEAIVAVEPTFLYYINFESYKYLNVHFPEFQLITTSLMALYYEKCQDRTEMLRLYRQERFAEFMKSEPELSLRISGRDLAAYLGMTEEWLSRLRSAQWA
ncbi:MAG: Crp/Fnr family transcriptional regulator [Flavisolibacter sp.]